MSRVILAALLSVACAFSSHAAEEDACEFLFVIRAASVSYDGSRMVLNDVDPNITWFCDRPVRQAGHMTMQALKQLVSRGDNNFNENPPNAAVSVFQPDGSISDAVVVLPSAPKVEGSIVDFEVREVDGTLPEKGNATVVFVDPIGRPLSPGSIAGVHRRHHRRAVRRHW